MVGRGLERCFWKGHNHHLSLRITLRKNTQVGDELVSVDGVRIKSVAHLKKLIGGRAGDEVNLDITHEGILSTVTLVVPPSPQHGVTLKGKGNQRWKAWITTRQAK